MRGKLPKIVVFLLIVLVCATGAYGFMLSNPFPEIEPTAKASIAPLLHAPDKLEEQLLNEAINRWYDVYCHERMIPIEPNDRPSESFGPWSALAEPGATDANDDGKLTEWADHYYIAHDWSDFGKQILTMQPDDVASVNGRTFVVQGIFNYPKNSFYEEITYLVGKDATVFQTCYPNSDENRIVYGW